MGQSSSALPSSLPGLALHCLRVADSSPASGLVEPFFDYLIGVDTDPPTETGLAGLSLNELGRVLEENEGKRIVLRVYNAKSQRIRGESASKSGGKEETDGMGEEVELVPSRVWSEAALKQNGFPHEPVNGDGDGDEEKKPSLLGLSLRACNPAHALESVYHVLDVLEGSPAEVRSHRNLWGRRS